MDFMEKTNRNTSSNQENPVVNSNLTALDIQVTKRVMSIDCILKNK